MDNKADENPEGLMDPESTYVNAYLFFKVFMVNLMKKYPNFYHQSDKRRFFKYSHVCWRTTLSPTTFCFIHNRQASFLYYPYTHGIIPTEM